MNAIRLSGYLPVVTLTVRQVSRLVAMVDGVDIQLLAPDGRPLFDEDVVPGDWPFVRPAPGTWDIRRWENERIRKPLGGCEALVNPQWSQQTPNTSTLARARQTSYVRVHDTIEDDLTLTRGQWILIHDRKHPVDPPRRSSGTPGQGIRRDGGVAIWLETVESFAWIEIMSADRWSPTPQSGGFPLEYLADLGRIPAPSGALRIAATVEDSYTDIAGRRMQLKVGFEPGAPNQLHIYVNRT